MTDLFWPGDNRVGEIFSDAAFLDAMVSVENAWLGVLVDAGVAPAAARADLASVIAAGDAEAVAAAAEADGSPVTALLRCLRARAGDQAGRWLHRGLTSQDVVDTALMLCLRDAMSRIRGEITAQVGTLIDLVETHRGAPMLARTLTQAALPTTIGMKMANWLSGVLDAAEVLATGSRPSVQLGGAAGTMAAATELTGTAAQAVGLSGGLAAALGLSDAVPWHTTRSAISRAGDALVTCCDAWGHIAADVATGSRTEIAELTEGQGGGSSTMPHKNNPVLSVLIRRAAVAAPPLAATLHTASALSVDERSDGAWHAEWATLRTLTRRTVIAAAQTTELLCGLVVHADRAATNLATAGDLLAEQRSMIELTGRTALSGYTGAIYRLIDVTLERARRHMKEVL
ncbi:MAG TPA: 3-carboxy-cis,cis-muconate cycloisomerase [Mycobacterium sp.]|nr:3-carboxy-cis,cis-muconate cycloisomerase [Mycobacterium sp.]